MSDEQLRAAERAGRLGGVHEEARLLVERMRAGTFPRKRVELLAALGDPRARIALGLEPLADEAENDPEVIAFEERLAETIVWCSERSGTPREVFRSAALRPSVSLTHEDDPAWARVVADLASARSELLTPDGWLARGRARNLAEGRLLLYAPDDNLFDGAAEAASDGFFDVDNVPPWDTWVTFVVLQQRQAADPRYTRYLVSWIPSSHEYFADQGVWVNPEECIVWANPDPTRRIQRARPDDAFLTKLRARGLLA